MEPLVNIELDTVQMESNIENEQKEQLSRLVKCDICGKKSRDIIGHRQKHSDERPYECDECHKKFKTKHNLSAHMGTHINARSFKCALCPMAFNFNSELRKHFKTHIANYPYQCELCGAGFKYGTSLNVHRRSHTGEKPYKCDKCDRAYTTSMSLKLHLRIHNGEKPYKCDICYRGFADLSTMKIHKRLHTGENPYICHLCGKTTKQASNLKSHYKYYHKINDMTCKTIRDNSKLLYQPTIEVPTNRRSLSNIIDQTVANELYPPKLKTISNRKRNKTNKIKKDNGFNHTTDLYDSNDDNCIPVSNDLSIEQQIHDIVGNNKSNEFDKKTVEFDENKSWMENGNSIDEYSYTDSKPIPQYVADVTIDSTNSSNEDVKPLICIDPNQVKTETITEYDESKDLPINDNNDDYNPECADTPDIGNVEIKVDCSNLNETRRKKQGRPKRNCTEKAITKKLRVRKSKKVQLTVDNLNKSSPPTINESTNEIIFENYIKLERQDIDENSIKSKDDQESEVNDYLTIEDFKTDENDEETESTTTPKKTYTYKMCTICNRRYLNHEEHMRTHTLERPYECDICQKTFKVKDRLRLHQKIHSGEKNVICDQCGACFHFNADLKKHMRRHSEDRPHTCTVCNKGFKSSTGLKVHMRLHTGEKPYKCTMCDKSFANNSVLKLHVRGHTGEKPYKCDYCDSRFSDLSCHKQHVRTHTGERPYKCHLCGKGTTQAGNLKSHFRHFHKLDIKNVRQESRSSLLQ